MINLMSYELKKQTSAARVNYILLRFVIILGFSVVFLILASSITYLFLVSDKQAAETQQMKIDTSSNPTQKQANAFRNNLTISKSILDRQISYGDLLMKTGETLPADTVLDSLTINDSSFNTVIRLKVLSVTSDNETKLKRNFESSSLFSNYKFESATSSQGSSKYPFLINISVTLNKGVAI